MTSTELHSVEASTSHPPSSLRPLPHVLFPVSPEEFFRDFFERRALHLRGRPSDWFSNLLSLEEIEDVVAHRPLRDPDCTVVRADADIPKSRFVLSDGRVDSAAVLREIEAGGTLVLSQLQLQLPRLRRFCLELGEEFSARIQTNIYLTPATGQGFKIHYDTHGVLILQLQGRKLWKLWGEQVALPLRGQPHMEHQKPKGSPEHEFVLESGDTLYIPHGIWHAAQSLEEPALHITTGILPMTWMELLLESVACLALEDPSVRKSLPPGFAQQGWNEEAAAERYRALVEKLAEPMHFRRSLDHCRGLVLQRQPLMLDGRLRLALGKLEVGPNTELERRPGQGLRLVARGEGQVTLEGSGRALSFPEAVTPALEFVLRQGAFRVGDIPELDDDSQIVLAKRLVSESLFGVRETEVSTAEGANA